MPCLPGTEVRWTEQLEFAPAPGRQNRRNPGGVPGERSDDPNALERERERELYMELLELSITGGLGRRPGCTVASGFHIIAYYRLQRVHRPRGP